MLEDLFESFKSEKFSIVAYMEQEKRCPRGSDHIYSTALSQEPGPGGKQQTPAGGGVGG